MLAKKLLVKEKGTKALNYLWKLNQGEI